jgi:hypothetical protein
MMQHRRSYLMLIGAVCMLCIFAQPSFALVYTGGADHITAPDVDPGWDNVGVMSIGSGAYLGDGWVIAPYHVYNHEPSDGRYVNLDQRYYEIPDTARRIEYSPATDADLIMFRIEGDPDAPAIELSSSAPLKEEVTIIASGRSRVGELVEFGGGYEGYMTEFSRQKRWGRNVVGEYVTSQSSSFGRTRSFMTVFDSPGLGDDECQLVANDSGGAVFVQSSPGDSWKLAGLALSVGSPYSYNGPSITQAAVYSAFTYYADLSEYRSQIDAIRLIPLPGDADWDGDVDSDDIDIFRITFGQRGQGLQADFNKDGTVDLRDFAIIRTHLGLVSGSGVPGASGLPVQAVPEPATIILLAGAIPLFLRQRRQRG